MTELREAELDSLLPEMEAALAPVVRAAAAQQAMRPEFMDELDDRLTTFIAADAKRPTVAWSPGAWAWAWTRSESTGNWRWRPAVAGLIAAGVLGVALLVYPRITPDVDAQALVASVENATERVPAGYVLHVIVTYQITPAPQGTGSPTLEQWFGESDGHAAVRRIGLFGETTIVDASGTSWSTVPGSSRVIKRPPDTSGSPPTGFNRATLEGLLPSGAQSRVVGRLAINGRPATRLEIRGTLPSPPVPQTHAGAAGVRPSPIPVIGVSPASGFLFSTTSQSGGGTLTSDLVVDDTTHEILQGHSVSGDSNGSVVGTADWSITTYELVPVSAAPADLFRFTPSDGTQVIEARPGEPVLVDDSR